MDIAAQHHNEGKHLHVVHLVFSFSFGGLEQIIKKSIETMPKFLQHTIICLTKSDPDFTRSLAPNVQVFELGKPPGQSPKTLYQAYLLLKKLKPDVLHSYNLATLEYQFIAKLLSIKVRIHAEHGRDASDPHGTNKKYILWRKVFSRFVDYHVCVSEDLYSWLSKTVNIPKDRARLIKNGVDTTHFCKTSDSFDNNLTNIYGHAARLDRVKNQANLVRAFIQACELSNQFQQCSKLVLVGDGTERQALERLIDSSSFKPQIEMWGSLSDMANVYRQFDVFVLSSDAEGIPMTILEAMSTKLPVLSTSVGGIPEVINDTCGYLVKPSHVDSLCDGFLQMHAQKHQWESMGSAGRTIVEKDFSQHRMNEEYLFLYQSRKR